MAQRKREDRRLQRTRQALHQAFVDVVREKSLATTGLRTVEKSFAATSIQEIAERANINRGTFYLHYTDKYQLADAVVREQFHRQLTPALPAVPRWDQETLSRLTQSVLETLAEKYHHQHHPSPVLAPMMEQAMQEELTRLLLRWLNEARARASRRGESLETIARVVSWTIFGSALQWSQEEASTSAAEMAEVISQIIMEGTGHLTN